MNKQELTSIINRLKVIITYVMEAFIDDDESSLKSLEQTPMYLDFHFILDKWMKINLVDIKLVEGSKKILSQQSQLLIKNGEQDNFNFLNNFNWQNEQHFSQSLYNSVFRTKVAWVAFIKNAYIIRLYFNGNKYWRVIDGQEKNIEHLYTSDLVFKKKVNHTQLRYGKMLHNYIENCEIFTQKDNMIRNLIRYDDLAYYSLNSRLFLPKTYLFNISSKDYNDEEQFFMDNEQEGKWIWKPSNNYGGFGIEVYHNKNDIKKIIQERKGVNNTVILIQKLIYNPLLMEGKKIDFRCFLLLISADPFILVFKHGYMRRTLDRYDKDAQDSQKHVSNINTQYSNPLYGKKKDEAIFTMPDFEQYVFQNKIMDQNKLEQIYNRTMAILTYTVMASYDQLKKKKGIYQIYGPDIILDENLNVYLLEINQIVYLMGAAKAHRETIPKVVQQWMDMVLYTQRRLELNLPINQDQFMQLCNNCKVLINDVTGFNYLNNEFKDPDFILRK